MIVLQTNKISKSFADKVILKNISFTLLEKERLALIGVNGSGKSTLLKCISGELIPDEGDISIARNIKLAYLEQMTDKQEDCTAWEAVMESFADLIAKRKEMQLLEEKMASGGSELEKHMEQYARISEEYERADGYACENKARRILIGLGFTEDDFNRAFHEFSGGQKTRLNLARLLSSNPELLVLDEPTNYLDLASVEWLEKHLEGYVGSILLVTHDRRFLERVCTRIIELKNSQIKSYPGGFAKYLKLKAEDDLTWQRAYEKQQSHILKTEEFIRKYKAGIKSKQARGRELQLARMERMEKPESSPVLKSWNLKIENESGQDVLALREISKSFNGEILLDKINLDINKGEKIACIGANGTGKSTLLKLIVEKLSPDQGEIKIGSRVKLGYFSQEFENLNTENNLLEEIMEASRLKLEEARTILGSMLFSGDDIFKKIKDLSGGEKARLQFLKIMLSGANFLILDEPTNHLDIESCQLLEDMLEEYNGTVLMVSHDRYFIDQISERIICLNNNALESYLGNYTYYCEKVQENIIEEKYLAEDKIEKKSGKRNDPKKELEKELGKQHKKLSKEMEAIEVEIALLEDEKKKLEEILSDPSTYEKDDVSRQVSGDYQKTQDSLSEKYSQWEKIFEEIGLLDFTLIEKNNINN